MKVLRSSGYRPLESSVEDQEWFFDTELLLAAWQAGLTICERPVGWIERRESRVRVPATIAQDLRGLVRVTVARRRRLARGEVLKSSRRRRATVTRTRPRRSWAMVARKSGTHPIPGARSSRPAVRRSSARPAQAARSSSVSKNHS